MNGRQAPVDFLHHLHRQNAAVRLAAEFVGTVAGAHRYGERIDLGLGDEVHGLRRIGEQLVMR